MDLPINERAFVIASIDTRCEAERKKKVELERKAKKGKRS